MKLFLFPISLNRIALKLEKEEKPMNWKLLAIKIVPIVAFAVITVVKMYLLFGIVFQQPN